MNEEAEWVSRCISFFSSQWQWSLRCGDWGKPASRQPPCCENSQIMVWDCAARKTTDVSDETWGIIGNERVQDGQRSPKFSTAAFFLSWPSTLKCTSRRKTSERVFNLCGPQLASHVCNHTAAQKKKRKMLYAKRCSYFFSTLAPQAAFDNKNPWKVSLLAAVIGLPRTSASLPAAYLDEAARPFQPGGVAL